VNELRPYFSDPVFYGFSVFVVFWFGAIFGSFFNVCIYRIPKGIGLSLPPSHCYRCGQPLRWYDNVPLISYWALGGRCRYCATPYSIRYFLVELLTAALFTIVFVRYCSPDGNWSAVVLPGWVFISLLLIATFTDLDHWIIPDQVSVGGMFAGFAAAAVWPLGLSPHNPLGEPVPYLEIPEMALPLVNSLSGAALGYGLLWGIGALGTIIFRKDAMGQGDMKLFAMFGAFLGPWNCLFVFMGACVLGSIFGLGGILAGWLQRGRTPLPALAPMRLNATAFSDLAHHYELTPRELIVMKRLMEGDEGRSTPRHHLPFGPSLALAAGVVFLTWEPLQAWFLSQFVYPVY
jgi:leader peptidase (prepilin peptidase) / N-methyltransferase